MRFLLPLLVGLLALTGCDLFFGGDAPPPRILPGVPFTLAEGDTAVSLHAPRFRVVFAEVTADNRCPTGVQCVIAGQADLNVLLLPGFGPDASFEMTMPGLTPQPYLDNEPVVWSGYEIQLQAVWPYPDVEDDLDRRPAYRARFVVKVPE